MPYPISVPKPDSPEDLIGYIDRSGRIIVNPVYDAGAWFSAPGEVKTPIQFQTFACSTKGCARPTAPAPDSRTALKDAWRRLEADGGHRSNANYDERASPGTKYRKEDGEP